MTSSPLFSTAGCAQSIMGVIGGLTPSGGCSGEPHCKGWCFSAVLQHGCRGVLLCSAESQESELLGSSPSEQGLEQKMSPPRGRKGRPSRGS